MIGALCISAAGLVIVVGCALVLALNQRSQDRERVVTPVVVLDREVAEIINAVSFLELGGRRCVCCSRGFVSTSASNRVCPTCVAASDPAEWRDAA